MRLTKEEYSRCRPKIPNFNSYSTLLDRIIIEHVKKSQFEIKINHKDYKIGELEGLRGKVKLQERILRELKEEFLNFNLKCWLLQEYEVIKETRTFA